MAESANHVKNKAIIHGNPFVIAIHRERTQKVVDTYITHYGVHVHAHRNVSVTANNNYSGVGTSRWCSGDPMSGWNGPITLHPLKGTHGTTLSKKEQEQARHLSLSLCSCLSSLLSISISIHHLLPFLSLPPK